MPEDQTFIRDLALRAVKKITTAATRETRYSYGDGSGRSMTIGRGLEIGTSIMSSIDDAEQEAFDAAYRAIALEQPSNTFSGCCSDLLRRMPQR